MRTSNFGGDDPQRSIPTKNDGFLFGSRSVERSLQIEQAKNIAIPVQRPYFLADPIPNASPLCPYRY